MKMFFAAAAPPPRSPRGPMRCEKISELKTVAFQLNKEQAIDLAKKLLSAAQVSNSIDVTGFRLRNVITVTTPPSRS
jgi:hypothetical protein